jgi:hypothetical protein
MANVASQVILHPTASSTLKILGTTVGRDKVRNMYFPRTRLHPLIPVWETDRSTGRHSSLHVSSRGISFQEVVKPMLCAGTL